MPISLGILGITGKLGRRIALHAKKQEKISSVLGCASNSSPWKGKDLSALFPDMDSLDILVEEDPLKVIANSDVIIDVSYFSATERNVQIAKEYKKPFVLGVTGYPYDIEKSLQKAALEIPIFYAANFSPGAALCNEIGVLFQEFLNRHYQGKIREVHHIHKKDSPSGTSLQLAKSFGINTKSIESERKETALAEHFLTFANEEESIEISHKVFSRDVYARGALEAAFFLLGKPAGFYTMKDQINPHEKVDSKLSCML